MLNVKKIFVLSLTASFLYESNAAIANLSQDFNQNNYTLTRRPVNRAANLQSLMNSPLTLQRGGHPLKTDVQPMTTGVQPLTLRRGGQPLTTRVQTNPFTLSNGVQTTTAKPSQTVAQPQMTGPLTLGRGVQTTTAKPSQTVVQPQMTDPLTLGRGVQTTTARPQTVIQPQMNGPLTLGRGGQAPAMNQEVIIINAADVNPHIRRMMEAQGKPMKAQERINRQELIEMLTELQADENQGHYPRGVTAAIKQELNRILRLRNYNTI